MALLPAKSANFGNRQAGYSQRVHTLLYVVKLRWSDYGINTFHLSRSLLASCAEIAVPKNLAAANITANRGGSNSILFAAKEVFNGSVLEGSQACVIARAVWRVV
jgi:hypothetical protein